MGTGMGHIVIMVVVYQNNGRFSLDLHMFYVKCLTLKGIKLGWV